MTNIQMYPLENVWPKYVTSLNSNGGMNRNHIPAAKIGVPTNTQGLRRPQRDFQRSDR